MAVTFLMHVPLIFDTFITLVLFFVSAGLGVRLLRLFRIGFGDRLEHGLFAMTLGLGALTFVPFALFAAGIGRPAVVVGVTLLLFVVLLPDAWRVVRSAWRDIRPKMGGIPGYGKALLLLMLPLLIVTFFGALCPPTDADGLHYHLTAPLRYLQAGHFYYMPTFLHVHWPLGIEMLFGIGQAFHPHYAAGMVQFGIGLVLLVGVYAIGRRVASPLVGWFAAGVTLFAIRGEMTWAYIDIGLALYTTMAGFAFYLGWLALTRNDVELEPMTAPGRLAMVWRRWGVAAVCAGLAATAKLPGLLTVGLIALMGFCSLWAAAGERRGAERLRFALFPAVGMLLLGLLLPAPWLIRSWMLTGAPVYPYFGGLFGAKDWSPEFQKRLNEYFQMFNTLRTRRLSPEMVIRARAITCLGLAVLGAAVCFWRGSRLVRPLAVFVFALVFLQVASSGIYGRYFFPMFPLGIVLILSLRNRLFTRSAPARSAALVAIGLLLWGLHRVPQKIQREMTAFRTSLPVALGTVSRDAYLTQRLPLYPTVLWCRENLGSDTNLVLGVIDCYASLFATPTLATNYWAQDALRYDTQALLLSDLNRLGATHILVQETPSTPEMLARRDKEARVRDVVEFGSLAQLCREYGTLVHRQNGYAVYALPRARHSRL